MLVFIYMRMCLWTYWVITQVRTGTKSTSCEYKIIFSAYSWMYSLFGIKKWVWRTADSYQSYDIVEWFLRARLQLTTMPANIIPCNVQSAPRENLCISAAAILIRRVLAEGRKRISRKGTSLNTSTPTHILLDYPLANNP